MQSVTLFLACCQAEASSGIDLLQSVAEEVETLPNRKKATFISSAIQPQAAAVLHALDQVLQPSVPSSGRVSCLTDVTPHA